MEMWQIVLAASAATAAVAVIIANTVESERKARHLIDHDAPLTDPQTAREFDVVLGRPTVDGNAVEHLRNGQEIFPAMLAAIAEAKSTITFETFIYWSGEIAEQFSTCLSERARAGVAVHVLLDWVGSLPMDDELVKRMVAAGVDVRYYHPLSWYHLWRMNNRTHRKLLIVDGRTGFIGGVGIADEWLGNAESVEHWRDSHFRVRGPVVAQLQAAFLDNWLKTAGRLLHGAAYFPPLDEHGTARAQVLASSPTGGSESMHLMFMLALAAAERTIDLAAAYFVPDSLTLRTLLKALERGVRVRIVVPGEHIDSVWVRYASKAMWTKLMRAGAEIYEYVPTMYHCKLLIVDGYAVSVGSTNFDIRSFRLNNEASLNVFDRAFADEMTATFETDMSRSRRIELDRWTRRPLTQRCLERGCYLMSSQL